MRSLNEPLLTNQDASVNFETPAISLEYQIGLQIQVIITGTPIGTLNLQGSDDAGFNGPVGGPVQGQTTINYTDVVGSYAPVTGAGSVVWNYEAPAGKWLRVVYIASSGTGTMNIRANTKSF